MIRLCLLLIILLIGCGQKEEIVSPEIKIEQQPSPPKLEKVVNPPLPPSSEFLRGYWDGYHGKWVGPLSWMVSSDYRNGQIIGKQHRLSGKDPQYPLR